MNRILLNKLSSVFKQNSLKYSTKVAQKLPKFSYISATSSRPLLSQTIGQRIDYAAEAFENRDSFVFCQSRQRLTFKDLKLKAEELAAGLLAIGLTKGDRVGVWAPNCVEWILTQYATAIIGVIQVNINPAYQANELQYSLNKVGCKGLVMSETYRTQNLLEILSKVCPELESSRPGDIQSKTLPHLKNVVVIGDKEYNGCFNFNTVKNGGDSGHKRKIEELKKIIQCSDPINIQYTSGTTGYPKGVLLSHHNILNNANQQGFNCEYDKRRIAICVPVPLYHCFGMVLASLNSICHGATCVFPSPTFNTEKVLKAIHDEKCTTLYGTPTMFIDVLNHPDLSKIDKSSMDSGVMAGSTCPEEVVKKCVTELNLKHMTVVYGLTEASPLITMSSIRESLEDRTQTIGKVMEHQEVKVVDKNGCIVPINEPGELLVRGYNTMIEYWDDKAKTAAIYTHDRFLKSGDIVTVDERGFFRHLSRNKDMIIRGGENIYPKEIEEFLHHHPKITDVYVVGLPDKRLGEELCACVKLKEGQTMTPEELRSYCKDKISYFKVPRYVTFMNEFPMTVTGKVQKNILREKLTKQFNL